MLARQDVKYFRDNELGGIGLYIIVQVLALRRYAAYSHIHEKSVLIENTGFETNYNSIVMLTEFRRYAITDTM